MGKQEPIRPLAGAALRQAVTEWAAMGCAVTLAPDGTITITPPAAKSGDPFDAVDLRR